MKDVNIQVPSSLSSCTPRKSILKRKLKTAHQKLLRYTHKLQKTNLKSTVVKLSKFQIKKDFKTVSNISAQYFSPQLHTFFIFPLNYILSLCLN
jgi:hypothetical protein